MCVALLLFTSRAEDERPTCPEAGAFALPSFEGGRMHSADVRRDLTRLAETLSLFDGLGFGVGGRFPGSAETNQQLAQTQPGSPLFLPPLPASHGWTRQHRKAPDYDEGCLEPEFARHLREFESAVAAAGGSIGKNSACRSTDYQGHLYEVWTRFLELREATGIGESMEGGLRQLVMEELTPIYPDVVEEVNREVRYHFGDAWPNLVKAPGTSPHEAGKAVDWTVNLPDGCDLDQLAADCGLCRPFVKIGEAWHFQLLDSLPK